MIELDENNSSEAFDDEELDASWTEKNRQERESGSRKPYTGEEVLEAMKAAGITYVEHHNCIFCGAPVCYFRKEEDELWFDSNCNCTPIKSELQPRSWDNAANWINNQKDPEIRQKVAARFGLGREEDE